MSLDINNPILQLILATMLGGLGVFFLLPRPRGRWVAGGVALVLCGMGTLAAFLITRFGQPLAASDAANIDWVGSGLFWLFAAGAIVFGMVLVTQRNPARGAIAFAFVILSTCGLFLLLAAPFLMAATIIIYAGAIIVTFLFVLMLSNVRTASDENDRSREPLLGALAGFAFLGLVLFTLHSSEADSTGPEALLTSIERVRLTEAVSKLDAGEADEANNLVNDVLVNRVDGKPTVAQRLASHDADPRVAAFLAQTIELRKSNDKVFNAQNAADKSKAAAALRPELIVYLGNGHLPARNVANLGTVLYSEYLLAVEMAGTLLLVATVGAVAIAGRRNPAKEVPA
ncbi:MAG: NADH-quinone oxidoreductase subunit J [Fimbriiglobus sp.]|nr:NADH-quinone oxidoreductase subunit J [Fimbriiglobus sp.]